MTIKIYIILIITSFIVCFPLLSLAADCPIDKFCPNVPFGDFQGHLDLGPELLGNYIRAWFNFIVGGVGILATVMIMYAGLKWLTSRGNTAVITDSKEKIWSAIIGMVLAFLSFTIFMVINPDLVSTYLPTLQSVDYDLPDYTTETYQNSFQSDSLPAGSEAQEAVQNILTECATNRDLAMYSCRVIFGRQRNHFDEWGDGNFYFEIPAAQDNEEAMDLIRRGESLFSILNNRGTEQSDGVYTWGGLEFQLNNETENNNYWEVRDYPHFIDQF